MFVARIRNNVLGRCIEIVNHDRGIEIIKKWCAEQDFVLTPEDEEVLQDTYEYYNDSDPDNVFTFCIGDVDADTDS